MKRITALAFSTVAAAACWLGDIGGARSASVEQCIVAAERSSTLFVCQDEECAALDAAGSAAMARSIRTTWTAERMLLPVVDRKKVAMTDDGGCPIVAWVIAGKHYYRSRIDGSLAGDLRNQCGYFSRLGDKEEERIEEPFAIYLGDELRGALDESSSACDRLIFTTLPRLNLMASPLDAWAEVPAAEELSAVVMGTKHLGDPSFVSIGGSATHTEFIVVAGAPSLDAAVATVAGMGDQAPSAPSP